MVLRIGPVPVWVAPSELVASARAVLGWTDDAVELVAALPARVTGLLDEIDGLLRRVSRAVQDVERLVGAADQVMAEVGDVAAGAERCGPGGTVAGVRPGCSSGPGRWPATLRWWSPRRAHRRGGRRRGAQRGRRDQTRGRRRRRRHRRHRPLGWSSRRRRGGPRGPDRRVTRSAAARALRPDGRRDRSAGRRFVEEFSENSAGGHPHGRRRLRSSPTTSRPKPLPILATLDRSGGRAQLLEVLQDVRLAIQGVPGFRMLRRRGEREEADGD